MYGNQIRALLFRKRREAAQQPVSFSNLWMSKAHFRVAKRAKTPPVSFDSFIQEDFSVEEKYVLKLLTVRSQKGYELSVLLWSNKLKIDETRQKEKNMTWHTLYEILLISAKLHIEFIQIWNDIQKYDSQCRCYVTRMIETEL